MIHPACFRFRKSGSNDIFKDTVFTRFYNSVIVTPSQALDVT